MDALWLKQGLLDDMVGHVWKDWMTTFIDSFAGRLKDGTAPHPEFDKNLTGADVSRQMFRDLQMAHAFYVTPEMCRLVTAAAEKLPAEEPVRPDDFPTPQGFMVIPGGLVHLDMRGQPVVTNAILWSCYGGKVHCEYMSDRTHPVDRARMRSYGEAKGAKNFELSAAWPRLTPWQIADQRFGQPVHETLLLGSLIPPEIANEISFVENDKGYAMLVPNEGWSSEMLQPHVEPDPVMRWLVACLRIMQQPLANVAEVKVPPNLRRQFRASKVRMKQNLVSVIEFRRHEGFHESGSGREFSHRFLRRGHWRRTPYKTETGEWDRRLVWIHPTIVGDPSKPLILREHVNALTR
jgi:hypothetical protein